MYQIINWIKMIYPKEDGFTFTSKVESFIKSGKRLPKPETMREDIYELISKCWKQKPEERIKINEVVKEIINLRNNL